MHFVYVTHLTYCMQKSDYTLRYYMKYSFIFPSSHGSGHLFHNIIYLCTVQIWGQIH